MLPYLSKERWHGLDLIRLSAFLAIIVFHSSWALWVKASGPPDPLPTTVWRIAEFYARNFSFSGFTILFLSSFLIGFKAESYKKSFWLPFFLIMGWVVFSFCTFLKEKEFSLEWDIYPLLGVGLLTGRFLLYQKKIIRVAIALLSVVLLLFPVWDWGILHSLPFYWGEVLIGQCPQDYADWPVLPWIGLIWLGMILGSCVYEEIKVGRLLSFHWIEFPLILFICVYFWKYKTAYFHTKLGEGWSCYTFRQEPRVFWSQLLFWMALIRVSFHAEVQGFLKTSRFMRWVSALKINQHFYLAYLLHYLVLFAVLGLLNPGYEGEKLWVYDVTLLLVFPLTEFMLRFFLRVWWQVFYIRGWSFKKTKT